MDEIKLTVWNEFVHENENEFIGKLYPDGIHGAIARYMEKQPGFKVSTATLQEPEHGLTEEVLDNTDVLTWWGHAAHGQVEDAIVDRVQERVLVYLIQRLAGPAWQFVGVGRIGWRDGQNRPRRRRNDLQVLVIGRSLLKALLRVNEGFTRYRYLIPQAGVIHSASFKRRQPELIQVATPRKFIHFPLQYKV